MHYHRTEYHRLNYKNVLCNLSDISDIVSKYVRGNINPIRLSLYRSALTHKSYVKIPNNVLKEINNRSCTLSLKKIKTMNADIDSRKLVPLQRYCNERLEYLGDAEIYSAVAHYLYQRYPEQDEGFMSKLRIKLVKSASLADLALKIGIDKYLLISQYQEQINARNNQNILENIMESFMGAVTLDLGPVIAREMFVSIMEKHVDFAELNKTNTNYKDQLLRYYQSRAWGHPRYQLLKQEAKPDAQKNYFTVYLLDKDGESFVIGKGRSKKDAEQDSSKNGLIALGIIDKNAIEEKPYIL